MTTYSEIGTPICKDYTYTTSKGATSQVWRMAVVEQSSSDSDTTMIAIKKGFIGDKGVFIPKTSILVPIECKDWLGEVLSKMECKKVAPSKTSKAQDTNDRMAKLEAKFDQMVSLLIAQQQQGK
jgi:hypothetical protein